MRIRKGHRCLPLAPADRSLLQEGSVKRGKDVGVIDDRKERPNEALLRLVAVAAAPVADIIGGPQYQERAKDTFMERNKCLEYDLEKNRVAADDDFNECSLTCDTGVDSTVRKLTETLSEEKSVYIRHKPLDTTGTISSSTISAIEIKDQLDLLEQSLRHVCSRAGMSGLSARDAVAQKIEQGLPGLNEGDERLIEQVAKSFRNSSKCEERGRYFLQDCPAGEENKSVIVGDSEICHEKRISSSDMVEAARQLQNLQKSHSNSLGRGVDELSEAPSVHAGNQKAVVNISEEFVRQFKVGRDHKDVTAMNQKASSSASRSQKVIQMDQSVSQCKRDDGKGWRCSRPAEDGFTMCKYHRGRSISQGLCRRKRGRLDVDPTVSAKSPPSRYVANARVLPDVIITAGSWSPFLDDELAHDERRQFVKAKSMKSLLLKRPKKF